MRTFTKLILIVITAMLAVGCVSFLFINYHPTSSSPTLPTKDYPQIYIRPNGDIETNGANTTAVPISRNGNIYTLNGAMDLENMTIEKSNIVFDGNSFPIQIVGPGGYKHGPTIAYMNVVDAENVTVRNLNVPRFQLLFQNCQSCQALNNNFVSIIMNNSKDVSVSENHIEYGATVDLENSSDCTVSNNTVANFGLQNAYHNKLLNNNMSVVKELAIRIVDSSSNLFFGNRIERSIQLFDFRGNSGSNLFVGNYIQGAFNIDPVIKCSGTNIFYHNNLINVYWSKTTITTNTPNMWDNGYEGNYWNNNQGASHILDANNQDRHPLSNPIDLSSEPQPTMP